ncbi:integrase [Stenotrophomonas sp. TEPEL]|uniref:site-specific integrase n=1 Tax=Stenotrophomonas sp. TEPEL TaxID=2283801 RepID=UPI001F1150D6|nr:integrase [Stenotrophomonas sp. TEPEL]
MARPRKAAPNLPPHIDHTLLPVGIYWDPTGRGRWYVRPPHEEGYGYRKKTVAGPTARMSDLHAIMEARQGEAQRGTVAVVIDRHAESLAFAQLKPSTQAGYKDYAGAIKAYPLKNGTTLGEATVDRLTPGFIRRLIDVIAQGRPGQKPGDPAIPGYPTKANHWLRYLRRVFGWAREHDHVTTNPATGIKQVKEKGDHRMPDVDVFRRVQAYAKECSARGPRAKGAVPAYLWAAMELAYQARLRGIEVLTLTDAHVDGEMLRTNRRKGSRDNLVRKGAQTEEAIAMLRARRAAIWEKNGGGDSDPGRGPLSLRQPGRGAVDRGRLADCLGAHDAQCGEGRRSEPGRAVRAAQPETPRCDGYQGRQESGQWAQDGRDDARL